VASVFRRLAKRLLPKEWAVRAVEWVYLPDRLWEDRRRFSQFQKLSLLEKYPGIAATTPYRSEINKFEFSGYSQNGEDGILLHIFSRIGVTNRKFVEIGIGDGRECNTANLSVNFGWSGLLLDSNELNVNLARDFYGKVFAPRKVPLTIAACAVTRENVESVLAQNGFSGEMDLLSIDIDGNEYWVWKAISSVSPRVVAIEYNSSFGPERAITIRYEPPFSRFEKHPSGYYHGASLQCLTRLAAAKGYVLVGCDSTGVNSFYVRKDAARGRIAELRVEEAFYPNLRRTRVMTQEKQFEIVKGMDFVECD
jgi:hypothetical protein